MANPAVQGAVCACSFGAAPQVLNVSSQQTVQMCGTNAATIMDNKFPPFGMCSNPSAPAVIAATAAAQGVFTPAPCAPALAAPWVPGVPTVLVCGKPLLNNTSKLMCSFGGIIQINMTPAMTVQCP